MENKNQKKPRKPTLPLDRRRLNRGAKKLTERSFEEYPSKIKKLALCISRNIPPKIAAREYNISPYMLKTYMNLKPFKEEVDRLVEELEHRDAEAWIAKWDELSFEAINSAIRQVREDKFSWNELERIISAKNLMVGIMREHKEGVEETERSITVKEKTKSYIDRLKELRPEDRTRLIFGKVAGEEEEG